MDPLDESYDPLAESYQQEDLDFVKGGAHDEGFAATAAEARKRSAHLASRPDRTNPITEGKKKAFLVAYSQLGIFPAAAAAAGLTSRAVKRQMKLDKDFAEMVENAEEVASGVIEMAILQRGVHGVQEEIWHKTRDGAELLGYKTVYSDSLLLAAAKARMPEKYRENHNIKHSADENGGGVLVVPGTIPLEQWSLAAIKQQAQYREAPPEE